MKATLIAIALVLAVTAVPVLAVAVHSPHVWYRYGGAAVLVDGRTASDARLFEGHDGTLLLELKGRDEWYSIVRGEPISLDVCGTPQGVSLLDLILVLPDEYAPCVQYNEGKVRDPHLTKGDSSIEFDGERGGRIRVVWQEHAAEQRVAPEPAQPVRLSVRSAVARAR